MSSATSVSALTNDYADRAVYTPSDHPIMLDFSSLCGATTKWDATQKKCVAESVCAPGSLPLGTVCSAHAAPPISAAQMSKVIQQEIFLASLSGTSSSNGGGPTAVHATAPAPGQSGVGASGGLNAPPTPPPGPLTMDGKQPPSAVADAILQVKTALTR